MPTTRSAAFLPFLLLPLLAQDDATDPVRRALSMMQSTKRPGLCLILPTDHRQPGARLDPKVVAALRNSFRERLLGLGLPMGKMPDELVAEITPLGTIGERLMTRLNHLLLTPDARTQVLLEEAVLLVAPAERVAARPGETLVLIDARGDRIAGAKADLADEVAFTQAIEGLLQTVRKPQPDDATTKMLALAAAETAEARRDAVPIAVQHWRQASPVLARELATAAGERLQHLQELTRSAMMSIVGADRAGLLPFGCEWQDDASKVDPCPACGMAMVSAPAKRLLKLAW